MQDGNNSIATPAARVPWRTFNGKQANPELKAWKRLDHHIKKANVIGALADIETADSDLFLFRKPNTLLYRNRDFKKVLNTRTLIDYAVEGGRVKAGLKYPIIAYALLARAPWLAEGKPNLTQAACIEAFDGSFTGRRLSKQFQKHSREITIEKINEAGNFFIKHPEFLKKLSPENQEMIAEARIARCAV